MPNHRMDYRSVWFADDSDSESSCLHTCAFSGCASSLSWIQPGKAYTLTQTYVPYEWHTYTHVHSVYSRGTILSLCSNGIWKWFSCAHNIAHVHNVFRVHVRKIITNMPLCVCECSLAKFMLTRGQPCRLCVIASVHTIRVASFRRSSQSQPHPAAVTRLSRSQETEIECVYAVRVPWQWTIAMHEWMRQQ